MDKEFIFERIEDLQEQQRKAVLFDNYKLEIDCMLLIIDYYNIACRVDAENKEKYLRTIEEQTKIVKEKMKEHEYYGDDKKELNDEIVKRSNITVEMSKNK